MLLCCKLRGLHDSIQLLSPHFCRYMAEFVFVPPASEETKTVALMQAQWADKEYSYNFKDITVLRFLRGHKGNSEKAVAFMEKHVKWRLEENVDNIVVEMFQKEHDSGKAVIFGQDKYGRPILYVHARKHNMYDRDIDEVKRAIIYYLEESVRKSKPEEEQICLVFDMYYFGMSCMDYEVVKMLISILQYNYPDVLGQAYIVGAPFIFSACWSLIKPWVDPVTCSKVIFCSHQEYTGKLEGNAVPDQFGKE